MIQILKDTIQGYKDDNIGTFAASVSYYTMFSLVPLLLFTLLIVGFFFNESEAQGKLIQQTETVVGSQAAVFVEGLLQNALEPGGGFIPFVIGIALLIWSGSGVFRELEKALNTIWQVKKKEDVSVFQRIKDTFLTFSMVAVIAFLLLVSLLVTVAISFITSFFSDVLPFPGIILELINLIIPFLLITLLFGLIYKILPDVTIPWSTVFVGAAFTSLLFTIGKTFIGMYLANSSVASVYGAGSSVVLLLLWVFYSSQIFFLGAEFTKAYAHNTNKAVVPKSDAVFYEFKLESNDENPSFAARVLGFLAAGLLVEILGKTKKTSLSDFFSLRIR